MSDKHNTNANKDKDKVIIIGLTGSYAMGKSTASAMFQQRGIPVHDADATVHALLAAGGEGVEAVAQHFPQTLVHNGASNKSIDRKKLGVEVFADQAKRETLESIVHPLVQAKRLAWLDAIKKSESPNTHPLLVVFDIPLLLETGKESLCDYIVVVSAPKWVQEKRALARDGMDLSRLKNILLRQMADADKQKRADYIIPTQFGITASAWYIDRILADIRLCHA